jgi:CheY-like chemotaxis protein
MNRILVVDDDEISRDMIEHTLGKAGYAVETAADGR